MSDLPQRLIDNGVQLHRNYLGERTSSVISELMGIINEYPLWAPVLPGIGALSQVFNSGAGPLVWYSEGWQNVYVDKHPITGKKFTDIPKNILDIGNELAVPLYPEYAAECCFINYYPRSIYPLKWRLHRDREEINQDAPVVSISLGATCKFAIQGPEMHKGPLDEIVLEQGDIVVMSGPSRKWFHGVSWIENNKARPPLGYDRFNITLRMVNNPGHYGELGARTNPVEDRRLK